MHMYVCLSVCLWPYTENEGVSILIVRRLSSVREARVQQHRLPGVEMTEVEVHMAMYSQWQVAHRQYKFDHDGG